MLADYWQTFQVSLFPHLSEVLDQPITTKLEQLIFVIEIVQIERFARLTSSQWMGRKQLDRAAIGRAFLAKAVYNLATTEELLDRLREQPSLRRLCGYESRRAIPSASTFSRAFAEFARHGIGDKAHAAIVKAHVGEKIVMHVSRDATQVEAREKPVRTAKPESGPKRKRGRPKKGEVVAAPAPKRLQTQLDQTPEQALADLPKVCNVGTKADSKGRLHSWVGWKAHIDWADGGFPLTVVTTSASVHDSQVAIPLAKITASRVRSLYDLMDSAYDAPQIHQVSRELGHVALIDPNPRRGTKPVWDPDRKRRYNERTTAERGNSRLKDEFGLRRLRVRGHSKAHLHIMFGAVALFADQLRKFVLR